MIEIPIAANATFDGIAARVSAGGKALRSLGITSTLHGEGATTVALGFALSLANYDANAVLLIDANWTRPSLTEVSGRENQPGLAECLRGEATLQQAVGVTARRGLRFLPAGDFGTESPPFGRLSGLIEQAVERFGKVVIDLPPVLVAPSLVVPWAAAVDQSYVILRRGVTPVGLVRRALAELRGGRPPQLILNQTADRSGGVGVLGLV
ncbi:MAG TPA: CpsD/CapB family tyrosine-protein kinase [Verrucomicrobiae bacterium]|nr:CpsD/CapB family tyrosine-protein kinase [Verrucomicrobiae bacterium]